MLPKKKKKCIKLIIIKANRNCILAANMNIIMHCYISKWWIYLFLDISKKVVGENGVWQLSNGECTTERNFGFLILMVNNQLSKLVNDDCSISWGPLRLRVIWFVHVLQHSVAETSFFLVGSNRKVERYISKFLVTGDGAHTRKRGTSFIKKAWASFVFGVKNPQTNFQSWCIHSHARWTHLMKFCISNNVTTVPFGCANSVRHSPFAIFSDNLFWNSCIHVYRDTKKQGT